ncbi:hypothetical protein [Streptomyces collinus]|uniref:hypothetical protein n=1 Tax=Streptomyces collinus TaxID=42684 RepID=UPI003679B975
MAKQRGRHRRPSVNPAKEAVLRQGGRALAVSAIGLGVVAISAHTAAADEVPAVQEGVDTPQGAFVKKVNVVVEQNYYDADSDQFVKEKKETTEQLLNDKGELVSESPAKVEIEPFDQMAAVRDDCTSGRVKCHTEDEKSLDVSLGEPVQSSRSSFNCTSADSMQNQGWTLTRGESTSAGGGVNAQFELSPFLKIGGEVNAGHTWNNSTADSGIASVTLKPGETGYLGIATPQEHVKGWVWTEYGPDYNPWYANNMQWGYETDWTKPARDGKNGVSTGIVAQTRPMTDEEKKAVCGG